MRARFTNLPSCEYFYIPFAGTVYTHDLNLDRLCVVQPALVLSFCVFLDTVLTQLYMCVWVPCTKNTWTCGHQAGKRAYMPVAPGRRTHGHARSQSTESFWLRPAPRHYLSNSSNTTTPANETRLFPPTPVPIVPPARRRRALQRVRHTIARFLQHARKLTRDLAIGRR